MKGGIPLSCSDYNITAEELQAFLNEKAETLIERVEYKNSILDKITEGLDTEEKKERVKDCGRYLLLSSEKEIIGGNFCKNRLCPVCNRRNAAKQWHKIKTIADEVIQQINPTFALLTLTVKNCQKKHLTETINNLMQSIDRLHKKKIFKENVFGFFRSLEITYNAEAETFHPHYHYILCLPTDYKENMISTFEWRQAWEKAAKLNYTSQIDITLINKDDEKSLSDAIAEVAKYAVKISSVINCEKDVVKTLTKSIKGRRLISFGGIIKEMSKQYDRHNKNDDVSREEKLENSTIFEYNPTTRQYEIK